MAADPRSVSPADARPEFRVDLTNCDREPIHIPGAIQPHGVLLVLREPELAIIQASENAGERLGTGPEPLLGRNLDELIGAGQAGALRRELGGDVRAVGARRLVTGAGPEAQTWDAIPHRTPGGLVLELEPAAAGDAPSVSVFLRVRQSLSRIQEARTLEALCDTMAEEVREITGLDRVTVYRFDPDWNGEVVAEARDPRMQPFLGLHFPATDIPSQARELYRRNWLRLIADVGYRPARIEPPLNPVTGELLDMSDCVLRSVSPIHIEYLRNMEVGASMSVSLLRHGELWGLIACHHRTRKHVPLEVRVGCELLGQAFSVQLGAVAGIADSARAVEIASVGSALLDRMAGADDWVAALASDGPSLLALTGASGAAICRGDSCIPIGETPEPNALRGLASWLAGRGEVFHTDRLPQLLPEAEPYAAVASGLLAITLGRSGRDYLLWFRPEVVQTVNWAGNPDKAVQAGGPTPDGAAAHESAVPRLHPRRSFQAWRETVRGRSLPWQPAEVRAAAELRGRVIDIVVRQADRLERLNEELRRSNDELDSFTYIASHDLKEPLRGIHTFSSILLDEQADALDAEGVSKLETLIRLTQRMDSMIDSLLTYSRVGKLELNRAPADLQTLVEEVLDTLRPRIEEAGTEIRIPRSLPTLRCDPVRAAAIFQNLIVNAIKYNDKPHGWVEIGWQEPQRPGGPVVLYVRDNGIGIAERHREVIFRIFRRLHARDKFGGGTGAGLTIVKRLVERHGGTIRLESVPGEGTTFYFTLGPEPDEQHAGGPQS